MTKDEIRAAKLDAVVKLIEEKTGKEVLEFNRKYRTSVRFPLANDGRQRFFSDGCFVEVNFEESTCSINWGGTTRSLAASAACIELYKEALAFAAQCQAMME